MTKSHGMLEGGKCAKKKKVEPGSGNDGGQWEWGCWSTALRSDS